MHAVWPLTALIFAAGTTNVAALPLTPFRYEAQAQRHCPDDTVVWLDFHKGIYYSRSSEALRAGQHRELRMSGGSPQ